jgi:hypothetical protein
MTEAFLHYIWQYQYFSKADLCTTNAESIQIIHPGMLNKNAGPDFEQARIRIAEVDWVGSVEIHINSEGWNQHRHEQDAAYENVILHVVWENRKPIMRKDGTVLPTLVLRDRVDEKLYDAYLKIMRSPADIPCEAQLNLVHEISKISMLEKTTAERLEIKANELKQTLLNNNNDWEETAYQLMAANFGFKVNKDPFAQLAKLLPYKILKKHSNQQLQVEALILGMSGLLPEESEDAYLQKLQQEFKFLSHKYNLADKQMKAVQWRLMRLRPANFPSIRLMQFAALISKMGALFSGLTNFESNNELINKLRVKQSAYWQMHYLPDKPSARPLPGLGKSSIENIIINSVVPLLVLYGKLRDEETFVEKAITLLQSTTAEDNRITRRWETLNWYVKCAYDSQALIGLYNNYCLKRRCLQCSIGCSLVRPR